MSTIYDLYTQSILNELYVGVLLLIIVAISAIFSKSE